MTRRFGLGLLPHQDPADLARLFRQADAEWGYDTLWIADERFYYDVYAIMALAAANTTRLRLGSSVTDPYSRHAAQTARGIATIDRMSGGRAILGIGAGVSGLREMGIAREHPVRWTRECIDLCRRLWQGGSVDFQGETVQFHAGHLDFPTRPDIPVFIAARAPVMTQLAGEIAEGVIFGDLASPLTLGYGHRLLARGAARTGRSPEGIEKVAWLQTFIHKDARLAVESARWMTAVLLRSSRNYHREMGLDVPAGLLDKLNWQNYHLSPENVGDAARHVPDEFIPHLTLAGDPDMVGQQVEALFAAGADHVAVSCWPVGDQTPDQGHALFAQSVIPQVKNGS